MAIVLCGKWTRSCQPSAGEISLPSNHSLAGIISLSKDQRCFHFSRAFSEAPTVISVHNRWRKRNVPSDHGMLKGNYSDFTHEGVCTVFGEVLLHMWKQLHEAFCGSRELLKVHFSTQRTCRCGVTWNWHHTVTVTIYCLSAPHCADRLYSKLVLCSRKSTSVPAMDLIDFLYTTPLSLKRHERSLLLPIHNSAFCSPDTTSSPPIPFCPAQTFQTLHIRSLFPACLVCIHVDHTGEGTMWRYTTRELEHSSAWPPRGLPAHSVPSPSSPFGFWGMSPWSHRPASPLLPTLK